MAAELEEKFAIMVVPRAKMMTLLEAGDNEQALEYLLRRVRFDSDTGQRNAFAAGGIPPRQMHEQHTTKDRL